MQFISIQISHYYNYNQLIFHLYTSFQNDDDIQPTVIPDALQTLRCDVCHRGDHSNSELALNLTTPAMDQRALRQFGDHSKLQDDNLQGEHFYQCSQYQIQIMNMIISFQ